MHEQTVYQVNYPRVFVIESRDNTNREFHKSMKTEHFKQILYGQLPTHKQDKLYESFVELTIEKLLELPYNYTLFDLYVMLESYIGEHISTDFRDVPDILVTIFNLYSATKVLKLYETLQQLE